MSLLNHFKQNTASIFDLTVLEVNDYDLTNCDVISDVRPSDEISTALSEYNFSYNTTLDFKVMEVYLINPQCGCTQGLVKTKLDAVKEFQVVDMPVPDTSNQDYDFGLGDLFIFSIGDVLYYKVDGKLYISKDKELDHQISDFFNFVVPQKFVSMMLSLVENKKELPDLPMFNERTVIEDEEALNESNVGNYPIEVHKRLVELSHNPMSDGLLISPEGKGYIKEIGNGSFILFFPLIDQYLINEIQMNDDISDQEEINDLFLGGNKSVVPVLLHYNYGDYRLIQENYPEFSIVGIELSSEQIKSLNERNISTNDFIYSLIENN